MSRGKLGHKCVCLWVLYLKRARRSSCFFCCEFLTSCLITPSFFNSWQFPEKSICSLKNSRTFCEKVTELEKKNAELSEKLQGGTSFTVFAPTNEAFENVTAQLVQLSDKYIEEIILFHFSENVVLTYEDLECSGRVTSMMGKASRTKCRRKSPGVYAKHQRGDGNLKIDQYPRIDNNSKEACNGIIFSLDHVMLPRLYKPFKDFVPSELAPPQLADPEHEGPIIIDGPTDSEEESSTDEETEVPTKIPPEGDDNTDKISEDESIDSTSVVDLTSPDVGDATIEIELQDEEKDPPLNALGINLIIFSTLLLCFVFVCMRR